MSQVVDNVQTGLAEDLVDKEISDLVFYLMNHHVIVSDIQQKPIAEIQLTQRLRDSDSPTLTTEFLTQRLVTRLSRIRGQLDLVGPTRLVLGVQVIEGLGNLHRVHHDVRLFLCRW